MHWKKVNWNCLTVISARWWSNMPLQRGRKLHILLASYGKRLRGWRGMSISPHGIFDGIIRPTIWMEESEIPLFTQACPVITPCAFSRPSSSLHRRVQASYMNDSNTSPDCSYFTQAFVKKINIYFYIYITCCHLFWPERNVTVTSS